MDLEIITLRENNIFKVNLIFFFYKLFVFEIYFLRIWHWEVVMFGEKIEIIK